MNLKLELGVVEYTDDDKALLGEFRQLWDEADRLWECHQNSPGFGGYVSADFQAVFDALTRLRGRVTTILEWGSGLGVVTMMASRMGFEAYGIESEQPLVDMAQDLADTYGPDAIFAQGSFVPDDFAWNPAEGDNAHHIVIDLPSAYDELDMEIRDFDVVYAYPWPDEHTHYQNIIRQYGGNNTLFLSYDAHEGIELTHFSDSN